ncbi:hypothetical protein BT63DRAFT_97958 [Microthyrium microscopicum]|uniref:Biogenesis of lysosome-related organelles complex 1 subunit KXD1 n=1 Tax=Microthyrium microscopicum TaxID=703497 RepID=A0A6A6TY80_9PEZI|nr:hypothetical protein BT63DRAFT_97958 [Microthyrium microscopicum]
MSSSQAYNGYYPTQPIAMPQKQQQQHYYPYPQVPYSVSPPEVSDSGTSGGPSYDPTATASSYAASASDYEGTTSTSSVDLLEFMHDRLQNAYQPMQMDQSLVQQTQASGEMNAKTRQLMELQALAAQRFAAMQAQFTEGLKTAKEVERDLAWTQKKVTQLNNRAAKKYAKEYARAQERYPAPMEA